MESSDDEWMDIPTNMFIDVDRKMVFGRQVYLEALEKQLGEQRIAGVSGMGGAGKTTLTCLYSYINKSKYKNGVFFVDSSNINTLPLNFAELAGPDILDLVPNPEKDVNTSIKLVSSWLQRNSNYLLIYDAADNVKILEELGKQRPSTGHRYIPPRMKLKGHVIISSRCPLEKFELVQVLSAIELEDLTPEDAHQFFWQRIYGSDHEDPEESRILSIITKEFLPNRLPLFLEQTASFIRSENITFKEYLKEAKRKGIRSPVGAASFGDNRQGLDDRFISNFDAVYKKSPEAALLMNLASLCHSRNVPMSLFSVGAFVLHTHRECELDEEASNLVKYLVSDMRDSEVDEEELFKFTKASEAGELSVKKMLLFPWETQLLKFARGGSDFSMHEVIQEQLRLRMKAQNKMHSALNVLATILLYMLKTDSVSLLNKRMFVSHADRCAAHMMTFDPFWKTNRLYLRLRIKTAYVFAWLGSFSTAFGILDEIRPLIPSEGMDSVHIEFLSVNARICIWQHRGKDALGYAQDGLTRWAKYVNVDVMGNLDEVREYALLSKSCAHALIMMNDPDIDTIHKHIDEGKKAFEHMMEIGHSASGQEEYAILIMLHGQMHRNLGYKRSDDAEYSQEQNTKASKYLQEAYNVMDKEGSTADLCMVHLILVDVKLGLRSRAQAIEELDECHQGLEKKLGQVHRFTAWVLEKRGQLMAEEADHEHAIELLLKSLEILKEVYGESEGRVQIGGTMLQAGKSKLGLGLSEEALPLFLEAETLLSHTPQHTAYKDVCSQIQLVKEMRDDGF